MGNRDRSNKVSADVLEGDLYFVALWLERTRQHWSLLLCLEDYFIDFALHLLTGQELLHYLLLLVIAELLALDTRHAFFPLALPPYFLHSGFE
jgi:hypothetical protein